MKRLAFTIQEMQSSIRESSDGSEPINEICGSPLLSSAPTYSSDDSDSPHIPPRIGDKFQVNVSPFKLQMGCDQLGMNYSRDYTDDKADEFELLFVEGLPVPVMQICCFSPFGNGTLSDNEFHSKQSSPIGAIKKDCELCQVDLSELENDQCTHVISNIGQLREENIITGLKPDFLRPEGTLTESTVATKTLLDTSSHYHGRRRKRGRVGCKMVKKMKVDFLDLNKHCIDSNCQVQQKGIHNMGEDASSKGYMIVPGSPSASWSKSEEDLFILGLYIFGKNLKAVKRFVETKEMGDILSHYYGKFFNTESYCRWAESRKTRSRRCIQGQRIFCRWRQQELMTRLIPEIPEHLKHEIPEVTKAFNDGKVSMEEFVTKLKALAGPNALVQAVGIGKGKEDLTAAVIHPTKTTPVSSSHYEIPTGKACSSLSTEEIIKFVIGYCRLSKAQADDLFWEAVWPRLLARGWRSEKPDKAAYELRQPLVFLTPGVQTFSRKYLTKGIDYFDSVSEVLSWVASDPRLLELDTHDITGVEVKPECFHTSENSEEENGHAGHPCSYLQPKQVQSFVFTVVDTSLTSQGVGIPRIRERVTLRLDDGSDRSQTVSWETEDTDNLGILPSQQWKHCTHYAEGDSLNCNLEKSARVVVDHESSGDRNAIFGMYREPTPEQRDCLLSPSKQRELTTCMNYKEDKSAASLVEYCESKDQTTMLKFDPIEELPEPEPILGGSSSEISISLPSSIQASAGRSINANSRSTESLSGNNINNNSQNSPICRLIPEIGPDLNLPHDQPNNIAINSVPEMSSQVSQASKSEETSYSEVNSGHPQEVFNNPGVAQSSSRDPDEIHSIKPQENNESTLQENVRRQSTRVRPLTTKALEAFACGFFSPKRRRKCSEKTLNPDGCRMKSISRLVQDDLMHSPNTHSSESNDILLGH
eukprot:PITA_00844